MSLGDEDVTVRRDEDVVRLREVLRAIPATRFAEGHQELAARAELEHLMALRRPGTGGAVACGPASTAARARAIRHPYVVLAVDEDPVGRQEEARAERRHQRSIRVELEHRGQRRLGATVRAATLGDPHAVPVTIDVDGARRTP